MGKVKRLIKKMAEKNAVVQRLVVFYRGHRKGVKKNKQYHNMSRKEVFSNIYEKKIWGGEESDYYSGGGSYCVELIEPYRKLVRTIIEEKGIHSVVDFGCGDFNVSSEIVSDDIMYYGVDIVPGLIERNQKLYGSDHIKFLCMDIVEEEGPDAELCLVREVFQHLSNEEIFQALNKLKKYKYVLITESVVRRELLGGNYNLDKDHGQAFGIYLNEPPFCQETKEVLRVPYPGAPGREVVSQLIVHDEV